MITAHSFAHCDEASKVAPRAHWLLKSAVRRPRGNPAGLAATPQYSGGKTVVLLGWVVTTPDETIVAARIPMMTKDLMLALLRVHKCMAHCGYSDAVVYRDPRPPDKKLGRTADFLVGQWDVACKREGTSI